MPAMTLLGVRDRLAAIESEFNAGAPIDIGRLEEIREPVIYCARQSKDCHPIPRLARLYALAKQKPSARELLVIARALAPANQQVLLMLANLHAEDRQYSEALQALEPVLDVLPQSAAILGRAADLTAKLGDIDRSLALHRRAAAADPARRKWYLNALIAANRKDEALQEARLSLSEKPADAALCFACFSALWKFSKVAEEVRQAREHLLHSLPAGAEGAIWRARLYKWEQKYEEALAELDAALEIAKGDPALLRDRAAVALALGNWGRDAGALHDAAAVVAEKSDLATGIRNADELLRAFGGSLEAAAKDRTKFSHVRAPESVFDLVAREAPNADGKFSGKGLAIIAHALTAGGAERIIATLYSRLRTDKRFDWVKLYLFNLSARDGSDFYFHLTGAQRSEIVLLDRRCEVSKPFGYLPPEQGRTTQAIYNQLLQDRPAMVHASLEPLTIYAGLAAMKAGVGRIVLHSHNMRPTNLHPDSPFPPRWRGCYKTLLAREEVRLLGVAAASMRDYADWIGLHNTDRLGVIYNGIDFDLFQPADGPDAKAALRSHFGIGAAAPLIGTAFKFREEKRPLLWVGAARDILKSRPDARFVMFGDGPLLDPTKHYVESLGLSAEFTFPGLVPDLHKWLPMLDVFLLSSFSEALPNVLIEAQAAGVPVVSRHVGGIAETMIPGKTGMLVEEDSAAALARAVLSVIDDPDWHAAAVAAGTKFVRERFDTGRMVNNLAEIMLGTRPVSLGNMEQERVT